MSKLNDLRIALAKMISGLNEVVAVDAANAEIKIAYETLEVGSEVYAINENGEYVDIPDGEYTVGEQKILVKDGVIAEPEVVLANEPEPQEIDEIRKEINELYARLDAFEKAISERLDKIEDKPAAEPAATVIENEPDMRAYDPKQIVAMSKRNFKK